MRETRNLLIAQARRIARTLSFLFVENLIFKKKFSNASITRIAVAMATNSAIVLSFREIFFHLSIV